jgi:hypothetical protein
MHGVIATSNGRRATQCRPSLLPARYLVAGFEIELAAVHL